MQSEPNTVYAFIASLRAFGFRLMPTAETTCIPRVHGLL
jgi:hypothetical protein